MPFDGTNYDKGPSGPHQPPLREKLWACLVIVGAVFLLVMPISAEAFIDIVRHIRGH